MKIIWLICLGTLFILTVKGVNEASNAKRKTLWDLNKSPPESPRSDGETNIRIPTNDDNLSNLQNIHKSQKRKAEEGKQGKRKIIKNTYLEGLTQQEKKSIRNKLWYATLSPEMKKKRQNLSSERYHKITREEKKTKSQKWMNNRIEKDPEFKVKYDAKRREEYKNFSPEKKRIMIQRSRASTLKKLASLTPQERERLRLEKNAKEEQRKILKKSTKLKD